MKAVFNKARRKKFRQPKRGRGGRGGEFRLARASKFAVRIFVKKSSDFNQKAPPNKFFMSNYCYLNGKILPLDKASVDLNDIGILRGYGVFEFMRTYNGKPFLLDKHFARFMNSAKTLNLKVPVGEKEIEKIIRQLLIKNKLPEAGIKLVLTGGRTDDGVNYSPDRPTFFVLISRLSEFHHDLYRKGAKLITLEYQREFPLAKTTNYLAAVSLQETKKKKGAIDILYTNKGFISECARSSFFIFKNNELVTTKDSILKGITRGLVIKLATGKFKVTERPIKVSELKFADEAFITSTDKEIMPIVKIDGTKIGNDRVGDNTIWLMKAFIR